MQAEVETNSTEDGLLLLHLSDIHFREPYCLVPETDLYHPLRTALLNSIRSMVEQLGPVDAVLVSGDIAYKGNVDEYKSANKWLAEVARVARCRPRDIYTVPGNHDTNRITAGGRSVLGVRELINKQQSGPMRDKELHDTLLDEKSGPELFVPMAEYNRFSAAYECDISRDRSFWVQDLALAPGWKLKMHGLTTTFLSGPDDDVKGELYLGGLQRVFSPDDGIVRLVIMHHPPDWCADHDDIDDSLWGNCALHLFGHKHRQRYRPSESGVRYSAGAVNPDRAESNWEPGYNFIKLRIAEHGENYLLEVDSHLLRWQTDPDGFVPKQNGDGSHVFNAHVKLKCGPMAVCDAEVIRDPAAAGGSGETPVLPITKASGEGVISNAVEATERQMQERDIVFHFWELSPSQRRKVMQDFGLLMPEDDVVPEPLRYRRAFERAREQGLMGELENTIRVISDK